MVYFSCYMIKDPNWYKARRNDGREGMIPFNYVIVHQDSKTTSIVTPPQKEPKNATKGEVKLQTMP